MDDWIDYYDSTHTIYASKRHRDLHFQVIARDIAGYISSPDAVVLDYSCGEALSAARVAEACGRSVGVSSSGETLSDLALLTRHLPVRTRTC